MWSDTISLECQQILLTVRTTGSVHIKETMSQDCRPFFKIQNILPRPLKKSEKVFRQQIMEFRVILGEKFKVLIYLEGI